MATEEKPITSAKIPGTQIPDITRAPQEDPAQKKWMSRVAVTTAVLATLASLSTMYATTHLNQAMITQIETADQWAFYQAKGIKLAVLEGRMETLPALGKSPTDEDKTRAARYNTEQAEIKAKAEAAQAACQDHRKRSALFGRASTSFQVAIALSAVALLVKKNWCFILSVLMGLVGCGFFVYAFWPAAAAAVQ